MLKPAPLGAEEPPAPQSIAELEVATRSSDDKERLVGLFMAPVAALIGFLIVSDLISHDPPARLSNGQINKSHVSVTLYHEVLIALLALAVVMLVSSMLRKRLYTGVAMALYGITVFNLKYWGFAIPYVIAAAWLIVHGTRLQRSLRQAREAEGLDGRTGARTASPTRASKRYTPPRPRPNRAR